MLKAVSSDDIVGKNIYDLIAAEDRNAYISFNEYICDNHRGSLEFTLINLKGEHRLMETSATPIHLNSRNELVQLATTQDITDKKEAQNKLQLSANVFTHAREGIIITDTHQRILDVNDAFSAITGYSRKEVLGKTPQILQSNQHSSDFYQDMWKTIDIKGHWTGEILNQRKNGENYTESLSISSVKDANGKITNYVGLFNDITQIKHQQQQLERIAHYDALTNLPNRILLSDRLSHAIRQNNRLHHSVAVAFIDLDEFKAINDMHGHNVGDELLIILTARMSESLREGDTLARFGGDEFIAVLTNLESINDCKELLNRLLLSAASPVIIDDIFFKISASIGVAFSPNNGLDANLLIRYADQAMYAAKQAGKNCFHLFDSAQDDSEAPLTSST
jgi:diguanylate cyclase (GGDEF)-like protein/PAS domain S-box-containing protein